MIHRIRVIRWDETIEENVDVEVDGRVLTCFACCCPYRPFVGGTYPVELELWAAGGVKLQEAFSEGVGILPLPGDGRYRDVGVLAGDTLDAGVRFQDEWFGSEYAYLCGRKVVADVDRIQISFEQEAPPV